MRESKDRSSKIMHYLIRNITKWCLCECLRVYVFTNVHHCMIWNDVYILYLNIKGPTFIVSTWERRQGEIERERERYGNSTSTNWSAKQTCKIYNNKCEHASYIWNDHKFSKAFSHWLWKGLSDWERKRMEKEIALCVSNIIDHFGLDIASTERLNEKKRIKTEKLPGKLGTKFRCTVMSVLLLFYSWLCLFIQTLKVQHPNILCYIYGSNNIKYPTTKRTSTFYEPYYKMHGYRDTSRKKEKWIPN